MNSFTFLTYQTVKANQLHPTKPNPNQSRKSRPKPMIPVIHLSLSLCLGIYPINQPTNQ